MSLSLSPKSILAVLLGLLAALGASAPAVAQEQTARARKKKPPPVGIEVQTGFRVEGAVRGIEGDDRYIRGEKTVPIRVVLDNNEDAVSGKLVVRGWNGQSTEMPVELPRKAHKEYTLFVRPLGDADSDNPDRGRGELFLYAGSRELGHQYLRAKMLQQGEMLVLCAAGEGSGLEFLNERERLYPTGEGKGTKVSTVATNDLPRQWAGYEGVDVLVLNGLAWRQMDDDQRRAARIWIEQGGHAVLCGETSTDWRDTEARALTGVQPTDMQSLSSVQCVAQWGGSPYQAHSGGLLTISGPLNPNSYTILSEGGRPLAVSRVALAGHVIWLGFDPFRETMRDWDGYLRFWKTALAEAHKGDAFGVQPLDALEDAKQAAAALPRLPAPPIGAILGFGVVYAVIFGPVNIWILRRLRRTVKSWLFVPSLALGMTLVVLVAGQSWGSARTILNSLSVLQVANGGRTAYEQSMIGLFSPTNRAFDLATDDPAPILEDKGSADPQDPGGGLRLSWPNLQNEGSVKWDALPLNLFSVRFLEQSRPRDLGGSFQVSLDDKGAGTVRNGTRLPLRAAYLYSHGQYAWIGDLPANGSVAVKAGAWRDKLEGKLPETPSGGLLRENQQFHQRLETLWSGARDLLIMEKLRKQTWMVAEVGEYRGSLQVSDVPYNNRAALLVLRVN